MIEQVVGIADDDEPSPRQAVRQHRPRPQTVDRQVAAPHRQRTDQRLHQQFRTRPQGVAIIDRTHHQQDNRPDEDRPQGTMICCRGLQQIRPQGKHP